MDNAPIVLAHAHQLVRSTPEGTCAYIHGDLRDTGKLLQAAADWLDFRQPVAVMLLMILQLISDPHSYAIVARLVDAVPPGSYVALSHPASDIDADLGAEAAFQARLG